MPGRPLTRARTAEAHSRAARASGAPFDAASRAHALERAELIGDKAAAAELSCSPATIRSWRRRAKGPPAPPAPASGDRDGQGHDLADLERRASEARQAEGRALAKVETLLAGGLASDARACSAVARDRGHDASRLSADANALRESEARLRESEQRLTDSQIWLWGKIVRLFIFGCGLSWTPAHEDLASALLANLVKGERDDYGKVTVAIPEAEGEAAQEAIDTVLRSRYRQEWERELKERQRQQERLGTDADECQAERDDYRDSSEDRSAPISTGEVAVAGIPDPAENLVPDSPIPEPPADNPPESDDLPSFESLSPEMKRRYALNKPLGRWEAQQAERRAQRTANRPLTGTSIHPSFRHPGM